MQIIGAVVCEKRKIPQKWRHRAEGYASNQWGSVSETFANKIVQK